MSDEATHVVGRRTVSVSCNAKEDRCCCEKGILTPAMGASWKNSMFVQVFINDIMTQAAPTMLDLTALGTGSRPVF